MNTQPTSSATYKHAITLAAKRWCRRIPWVDRADLEQQAWCELLPMMQQRTLEHSYVFAASIRAMQRYCIETSVPITGSTKHTFSRMRLLQSVSEELMDSHLCEYETPESLLDQKRYLQLLYEELVAFLGYDNTVFLLLCQKFSRSDLAFHYRCDKRTITLRMSRLYARCRRNETLRFFWSY